ncbi:MAG: AAA family ATPase [Sphingobacteriales bacterium]|nr:AAA family ATPase [Sphingobacteriales bacterium]
MSNSTPSSTAQTAAENSYRDQVRDALRLYLDDKSISQSDFAKAGGASNATVTQVLNGTYAAQGDVMHNKIATYLRKMGVVDNSAAVWKTLETANYATMRQTIAHAQQRRGIYCICGDTGSGKTTAMTDIARKMPAATYLLCDYLMTKKAFVSELAQAMGVRIVSNNIRDLVQAICDNVRSKKGAVLLLDDVGKLPQAS